MAISQRVAKLSLILNGVFILLLAFAFLFSMVQVRIADKTAEEALYQNGVARINKYNATIEYSRSRLVEAEAQKQSRLAYRNAIMAGKNAELARKQAEKNAR